MGYGEAPSSPRLAPALSIPSNPAVYLAHAPVMYGPPGSPAPFPSPPMYSPPPAPVQTQGPPGGAIPQLFAAFNAAGPQVVGGLQTAAQQLMAGTTQVGQQLVGGLAAGWGQVTKALFG
jgi:hypothetical protein